MHIGVGKCRILGGGGNIGGRANSQQAHDVVTMSMRRNDVASTSLRRHVPTRFIVNQGQTITFLILKSDIIENSRIELRGVVCQHLQIKLKLHLLLFYPSAWYICDFFLFYIEIEGKGWNIGGPKGYVGPPLKLLGGELPPTASPPPLSLRL